ncbi:lysozyme family protein [Bacillus sp. JJ1764]|uniref:lysozyme family protein n=1 Tax=Bacillus sp. JJ1764 TaxID=3122964 RepID=UPI002FFE1CB8
MRKHRRKKRNMVFVLFLTFCALAMFQHYFQLQKPAPLEKMDPFAGVKKYRTLLYDELAKYNLQEHTDVLIAVMQQESHGQGGDPMQASESVGLARNSIQDPKQSIEAGVKHFQQVLSYGNSKKVDFPTIIQAYNMGRGYIDFVAQHGGRHSEELAKQYSLLRAQENPTLYNCGGDKKNFRYPYCYGDFTYSTKVSHNLQLLSDSIPVNGDGNQTGGSF